LTGQEIIQLHQDIPNPALWVQWFEFLGVCVPIQIRVPEIVGHYQVDKLPSTERKKEYI